MKREKIPNDILDILLKHMNEQSRSEKTYFHNVLKRKDWDSKIIKTMLKRKFDPNQQDSQKNTPFHIFYENIENQKIEENQVLKILKIFLTHKADPNMTTKDGNFIFNLECKKKYFSQNIVSLLLDFKAYPFLSDRDGFSVSTLVKKKVSPFLNNIFSKTNFNFDLVISNENFILECKKNNPSLEIIKAFIQNNGNYFIIYFLFIFIFFLLFLFFIFFYFYFYFLIFFFYFYFFYFIFFLFFPIIKVI